MSKRDQILVAAADCFAEVGYLAATVSDIVARAGTTAPTFYRYFAGKSEVLEAVIPSRAQAVWQAVSEALAGTKPGLDQVVAVVRAGSLSVLRDPMLRGLMANPGGSGESRATLDRYHLQMEKLMVSVGVGMLSKAREGATFHIDDVESVVVVVVSAISGWCMRASERRYISDERFCAGLGEMVRASLLGFGYGAANSETVAPSVRASM